MMKPYLITIVFIIAIGTGLFAEPRGLPSITELKDLRVKAAAFEDATRTEPIILKSLKDATQYFEVEALTKISKAVDFEKQQVLVFAWEGSGQDRLTFSSIEGQPGKVKFPYQPGRTRDLRRHTKVFVLLSTTTVADDAPAKQLADSLEKWKKIKRANAEKYSYQVRTSSFIGARTVTTITVDNDQVTQREYREIGVPVAPNHSDDTPSKPVGYVEQGDDVGSDRRGAAAKTVDELYAEAKKVLESQLGEHEKLYFKIDARGLLLHCFKVNTRIADDAPIDGVRISNLRFLVQ